LQYIKGQEEEEKEKSASNDDEGAILSQVTFINCPIKTSLGVLGKKWTILIIRDICFRKIERFNWLLESMPDPLPPLDIEMN
jgi:DNA-binding HxlR family transcriptional regulator